MGIGAEWGDVRVGHGADIGAVALLISCALLGPLQVAPVKELVKV